MTDQPPIEKPKKRLTRIQYAVLAICGVSGATAYDLKRVSRTGNWGLLGYSKTQLGQTPKVLAERGLLHAVDDVGQGGRRVVRYYATERGLELARGWLAKPPRLPPVDSEAVVRVLADDLLSLEEVYKNLLPLDDAIKLRRAELDIAEVSLDDGSPTLRLAFALQREVLGAYLSWLKQVKKELREHQRHFARQPRWNESR